MAEARYLYCIVEGNEEITLGNIGIEGNNVYVIPYQDLSAVVHNCLAEPYKSEDQEKMKSWVTAHEKVVEIAWEKFGTVLPLGFDTIIKGEEGVLPDENMKKWLRDDYENLRQKLAKLKDKAEFGVQVFWDLKIISEGLIGTNPEIKKLSEEIKSKSRGLAYMYKQKLENLLKKRWKKKQIDILRIFMSRLEDVSTKLRWKRPKNWKKTNKCC